MKTYAEINEKIKKGTAVVLTAEEVSELSKTLSPKEIAEKVDVVTTATFGAMCSSGAFLNFGHSNPPIRMEKIELNGVRVSGGLAAVVRLVYQRNNAFTFFQYLCRINICILRILA